MDFGDILSQWDDECRKNTGAGQKKGVGSNVPRKRLANASDRRKSVPDETVHITGECADDKLPQVNPMDMWLRRYGVMDKDAAAEASLAQEQAQDREYLKMMPPEAKIDLHGLTRDEAWGRLDCFISDCSRRGLQKVLIVHGKGHHSAEPPGSSVLGAMVRSFIECDKRLGASGHPDKKLGGTGATWVIIRKK